MRWTCFFETLYNYKIFFEKIFIREIVFTKNFFPGNFIFENFFYFLRIFLWIFLENFFCMKISLGNYCIHDLLFGDCLRKSITFFFFKFFIPFQKICQLDIRNGIIIPLLLRIVIPLLLRFIFSFIPFQPPSVSIKTKPAKMK